MPSIKARLYCFIRVMAAFFAAAVFCLCGVLWASLPAENGTHQLPDLASPARAELDEWGIPRIMAQTREDAFRVLGFVIARDRLFQMDLLRRHAAGRLAEVLGPDLAEVDRWHRIMGFEQVASTVLARLPKGQRVVFDAYADGVNRAVADMAVLPPEFLALAYRFSTWRPEDSLLVVLGMEENLTWTGDAERMATVMKATLPAAVYAFLTPTMDRYTDRILNSGASRYQEQPIPIHELASLMRNGTNGNRQAGLVGAAPRPRGSNGWVVGPSKTRDGRALLANDMHLSLSVSNIWYRAELRYRDIELYGFTLPGVPLVVAGSNQRIAWGFTNIEGDFSDFVLLDGDPLDAERYRTPEGFARFSKRTETVRVRGESDRKVRVCSTIWGPVLSDPLLGQSVAVHWTILDPDTTDLRFLDLDRVATVDAALSLFNRAGGPPLNALVADHQGNIGWTYSGRIPKRFGLDGSVSLPWADGLRGWNGYILPAELPRVVNPESGFIVNANQRMVDERYPDERYPYVIGHHFGLNRPRLMKVFSSYWKRNRRNCCRIKRITRTGMRFCSICLSRPSITFWPDSGATSRRRLRGEW